MIHRTVETPFMKRVRALEKPRMTELSRLLERFDNRSLGFKLTSTDYQKVQRRLLVFLLSDKPSETFLTAAGFRSPSKEVDDLVVAPSTANTYWVAITSASKALQILLPDAAKVEGWLSHICEMYPPARPSVTLAELLEATHNAPEHIKDAMFLSYLLGQRLGDVLMLQQRSVTIVHNVMRQKASCAITFYEGKTVGLTGVYTLHVPLAGEAANILSRAQSRDWQHLFVPHWESKETVRSEMNLLIGDVRALRRGGLQMMALMETPMEEILIFSRHKSTKMLYKYLQHGAVLMHQANQTEKTVDSLNRHLQQLVIAHPEWAAGPDE